MNSYAPPYVAQIDGLRAIAIIWVVAFHYFPEFFSGGYIGVDVFFVISGYLISGIIWKQLDRDEFSFIEFYRRRIRRIFPALLTVLSTCLILGFLFLHNQEYRQLSKHVFASSLFLNNWALSIDKGYFDVASENKPLLHLWSLSIEEQFYLVWPLLLWSLASFFKQKKYMVLAILTLGAISLLACLIQTPVRPVGSFYSPHTRIWELILGSVVHLIPLGWKLKIGRLNGGALVLLVWGLFYLTPQHPFPGYWALLPTLSALILICASSASMVGKILSLRPMVMMGLISYPLYLWHWPIWSFSLIYTGAMLTWPYRLMLIGWAIILAYLTKKWIEDPLRFGPQKFKTTGLVLTMILLSGLSVWIYQSQGLPHRTINDLNISLSTGEIPNAKSNMRTSCPGLNPSRLECWSDWANHHNRVVIGDSKGKAVFLGLTLASPEPQGWLYLGGNATDGAPVPQNIPNQNHHQTMFDHVVSVLDERPEIRDVVFAVATRSLYGISRDDSLEELANKTNDEQNQVETALYQGLAKLSGRNRKVYVVIDNPTFLHPPKCASRKIGLGVLDERYTTIKPGCSMTLDDHLERTQIYRHMLYRVQAQLQKNNMNVMVIDTTPTLCDHETRRCEMVKEKRYLYDFTDHTSPFGSMLVGEVISNHMKGN